MKKQTIFLLIGCFLVGVASTALILFGYINFENWKIALKMEGAQIGANTIIQTIQKEGNMVLYQTDKNGKKNEITLTIQEPKTQEAKK